MEFSKNKNSEAGSESGSGTRLIPRITIQAFCEHSQTAELIDSLVRDRRMSRVALTTHNGGIDGAVGAYHENQTPNLIIVETTKSSDEIIHLVNRLAEVCDSGTRLIVLGHVNDVILYRELKNIGVSEYLVLPASPKYIVDSIADLFIVEGTAPIGRSVAFIAAKGGAGSSSVAHNSAWAIAQNIQQDVLIIDMDLGFGTVGLNFNQDPTRGIADAVFATDAIDAITFDRLMSKAANHLNILAAPATLDKPYDFGIRDFEQIIELSQQSVPIVILDIPHVWNDWVRHTLSMVDHIVITAEPDLASLRNAKNLIDSIKQLRPEEKNPFLIVNKTSVPKRPEINSQEFATSIDCELFGEIAFDAATFGTASNNGQMISEISNNHKSIEVFNNIAYEVMGRNIIKEESKKSSLNIPSLMKLLKRA
jgi:pilus assembly protein CpaE